MTTIKEITENGIKFSVSVTGTGDPGDPYRPAIFDTHDGFFHLESIDVDGNSAVLWVNKGQSPTSTVDDIREENTPLGSVLEETNTE